MLSLAIKWIINAGAVFFVGRFLSGIHVPDVMTAVWVALALGIINTFIRPILKLLTFPITLLTLGLFTFILNGLLFWAVTLFVKTFTIDGFLWAVAGAFIVSLISTILSHIFLGADGKVGESQE